MALFAVAIWRMHIGGGCAEDRRRPMRQLDSSPVQLGDGAGIYARHGITVEAVCTQGTGETQAGGDLRQRRYRHRRRHAGRARRLSPRARRSASSPGARPATPTSGSSRATRRSRPSRTRPTPTTIAYSSNGASTHSVVLGLIRELGLKGKPVATGGPAATLTVALSGQIDVGWTSPPLASTCSTTAASGFLPAPTMCRA